MLQIEKSNAKIVICNAQTADWAKEVINSIKSSSEMKVDLFCLDVVQGFENILQKLESLENTVSCEPVEVDDIEANICLIFWNSEINTSKDIFEKITHAEAFILSMKLCIDMKCSTKDVIEGYNIFDKEGLLLALCALERKLQFALFGSKSQSKSLSPLPKTKPYTFKRPKIRFTMDDLENEEEEDNIYECKKIELPKRMQPQRNCQNNKKSINDKNSSSDSSSDEIEDDQTQADEEKYDYKIKEYYDKHGTNPPWQKDRGGIFACPHCNLDCKTREGLDKHVRFYHQKWANSNESSKEPCIQSASNSDSFDTEDESQSENSNICYNPGEDTSREIDSCDENFEEFMSRNINHDSGEHRNWETHDIQNTLTAEENPRSSNRNPESSPKKQNDNLITCWYCRKKFEKGPVYDNHYSICYDNYAYLHM